MADKKTIRFLFILSAWSLFWVISCYDLYEPHNHYDPASTPGIFRLIECGTYDYNTDSNATRNAVIDPGDTVFINPVFQYEGTDDATVTNIKISTDFPFLTNAHNTNDFRSYFINGHIPLEPEGHSGVSEAESYFGWSVSAKKYRFFSLSSEDSLSFPDSKVYMDDFGFFGRYFYFTLSPSCPSNTNIAFMLTVEAAMFRGIDTVWKIPLILQTGVPH